jgi:hypothetical protein
MRSWSTMMAGGEALEHVDVGPRQRGMKPCKKALYVSLIMRCDSAAMVPNTSDDLPEPETPVNTVSRRLGMSTFTSFRLFSRAPRTRIRDHRPGARKPACRSSWSCPSGSCSCEGGQA